MTSLLSKQRAGKKLLLFISILFAFLFSSSSVFSQTDFSPTVGINLSSFDQGSLSDISFTITQDADQSDISSSIIVSNGGSFAISSLSVGDNVGFGTGFVGGGSASGSFTLFVDDILSSSQASLEVVDDSNNDILGSFTIQNVAGGVQILSTAPADGNTTTAGNTQEVTLSGIFTTPDVSSLTISSTLNAEMDFPADIQSFGFDLEPSVSFSPIVEISLSNLVQGSLSDISFTITQDADQSDISSSIIVSNGGSFAISSLSVGDNVGFGTGFVGGGSASGSFTLFVDDILSSSQASLEVVDDSNNDILGSFTIQNVAGGVQILSTAPADGNTTTAGNTQEVTLSGIFTTPDVSSLTISSTLNAEMDFPADIQSFGFDLEPSVSFSPIVEISLSNLVQGSLSDISFTITQDADQSDISSSIIVSNGGSFAISSLSVGDNVGFGTGFVGGGSASGSFTLFVDDILSSSQASLEVVDDSNNDILGSFTIQNVAGGVQILSTAPADGNTTTAGNTQEVTLSGIFTTPDVSSLTISSTLNAEMDFPADIQSFGFDLEPSVSFSPIVEISLSNLVQGSLSDISFTITQDADQSDISSSIIVSNGGSFAISSLSVGDNVGFGTGFVGGGSASGSFTLFVDDILSSSQASLEVVDDSNNDILGSFTIQNVAGGVQILSTAPADGNTTTAGNTQEVTLSGIFTTPDVSSLTISSTLNAEMDFPADIQSFGFDLEPSVSFSPIVEISLSNLVQGSLSDISFTITQDADQSDISSSIIVSNGGSFAISSLSVGDNVGFGTGFVGGGSASGSFTLFVDDILSSSQASLEVVDDSNNDILGSFTIQNVAGGVQILSTAPADGNTTTAGNTQEVTLSGIFTTPDVSSLTISSTLNAEMDFPADIQSFGFDLEPSVSFSPIVEISLSNLVQGSLSDISFTITQDADQSDISSSIIVSNGGSFAISSLSVGDNVGFGTGFVGGGSASGSFTLFVDDILSSSQASLEVVDDSNNDILGSFTIQNVAGGVQILSTAPADGNTTTAGNTQEVTLSGIFTTPDVSSLTISSTLNAEMDFPADIQSFGFDLEPSVSFSPIVEISLSNLVQGSLSDISFTITQDADQSDISSSIIVSNGGSFAISSLSVGDNVGFGTGFVGGGSASGSFTLFVDDILSSSQASLEVVDDSNNDILGSFTIQNVAGGVQILSTAPADGNTTTAGNTQEVTLSGIFTTPDVSSLTISSTLNAEMDFPADIQSFGFDLEPSVSFSPIVEISLSNLVQGSLSDISFTITQDADQSDISSSIIVSNGGSFAISSLSVGDNVGFGTGFVGGGSASGSFTLFVDDILSSSQASLEVVDDSNNDILGSFTIQNVAGGVQILSTAPADGNTTTAGNTQEVTLSGIFTTPDVSSLTISSTLNAEMDFPADIQSFGFDLEPSVSFSPIVEISLSNLVQGSLSDISFTITQDADQSDISSSIIVSNGGSFAISSLSVGDNVGFGTGFVGGGSASGSFTLFVDDILSSSQASLEVVDDSNNDILGSFTIQNVAGGVQILSTAPADGNTTTAGNTQEVTLSGIFTTPDVSSLTISSTLNAEMDFPADIQSFGFDLEPSVSFSPIVEISLSNLVQGSLSDISFTITQDADQSDISSSIIVSNGGSFAISSLSVGDNVGFGTGFVGGGSASGSFTLFVDDILSSSQASLEVVDDSNNDILGSFTIQNVAGGVQILSTAPADGNTTTAGNTQEVTLSGIFTTPDVSSLTISSTLNAEMDFPADIQSFSFDLGVLDCNGDFNGESYIDDCGNCVGGNSGEEPCIDLNPEIEIIFSNNECNTLSDIEITITQTANQPDMSTSLVTSDEGYFDISSLIVGQVVGTANLSAAAGEITFESQLIVESILGSNQATLSSINIEDESYLGSFTISNNESGISIFASNSYSDDNNVTAGNTSFVNLNNLFVNPDTESFNLYTSIDAEVGPSNYLTFIYDVDCPCLDTIYVQNILLCYGESLSIGDVTYLESGSYFDTLISANGCDSIINTNLTFYPESNSESDLTACDSFDWNGVTYTESGTYTYNTTNVNGCDSTATLNLTINTASSSSEDVTACDSFDWNGITYTESGTYTYTTTNSVGCDSTATLNLTINTTSSSSEEASACDSFVWNGEIYTESGVYTYTTTNSVGCDSTATLNLTINTASSSSEDVTACDSFDWNGITYTESGTYTYTTTNSVGCDSTATLDLTINTASSSSEDVTACDSFDWNGVTYTESGTYTYNTTNVNGCDSTATLNLTINTASSSSEDVTACDGFDWNGITYTESGTYTYTTTNSVGCDSTATLNLTINTASSSSEDVTACDSFDWNGITYTESATYTYNTTNSVGCDSTATLNLTINTTSSSSEEASACDSFDWNGVNYTESGTYTYNTTNVNGCDSTATLNLTINTASSSSEDVTACDGFDWNGITYTESGTYTYTTTNSVGCDSTATLNLTINTATSSSEEASACDIYAWNGEIYTESGVYTYTTTNSVGCDSTVTLNLTINTASSSSEDVTACDSFDWNGITYTESGTYTYNTTNSVGCDSTATLNLTINTTSSSSEDVTACDGFDWNGITYTESGTYTYNTTNSVGCDSTATLNLTINTTSSSSEEASACDIYVWNGEIYTESGVYTYTTTNSVGCDSTATLNLTINTASSSSEDVTACDSFDWNGITYTESGTYTYNTTNSLGCDSTATLNLTINTTSSSSEDVIACDSFDWNGITYTESGTYTYNTTNSVGCDSTATLNLTINTTSSSSEEASACDSFVWNGEIYTESGVYTYTTTNSVGCDSTATLNLTINTASSSSEDVTACDSFDWNGITYTESGTYTYNTTNSVGCDSTATLNLTINTASSSSEDVTACDSFDWNGITYTESGTYTYNTTNSVGCDSTATLNLTINTTSSSSEEASACDSFVWNGEIYTESGVYTYTTTNSVGCDSTATLNLTINTASSSSEDVTACDSFDWNGITYTESGTYTYNTTNSVGCDSTATLNLTINTASSSSEDVTACDSFDWNGVTYTESGTYTYNTTNSVGCDSTATLNLTINMTSSSSEEASACDSFVWNGEIYTESGVYTYTTTNSVGCDSIATLTLIINVVDESIISINNITTNSATIDWDSVGVNYDIYISSDDGSYTNNTLNFINTSISVDDLEEDVSYNVNIVSYDENGCSSSSNISFSTLVSCNLPQDISFDFTPSTVTISWDNSSTNSISTNLLYNISNVEWIDTIVESNTFTTTHNGVGNIQIFIRSICDDNYFSEWSELISQELPSCDISLVPSVSSATCIDSIGSVSFEVFNSFGAYSIETFDYNLNELNLGTYTFSVIDEAGCIDSTTFIIELEESAELSVTASADVICSVDEAILTANSNFVSYQWYNDEGVINGALSASFVTSSSGNYYVEVVDSNACQAVSEPLTINAIYVQALSTLEVDNIISSSASLDWDNASPTGVYNISYSADGGLTWVDIIGHTGSSINLTGLSPSTTYDVEITSSAYGCESEVFSSSFTTEEDCIVPENISLTATPFEVTLSWDALVGADSYKVVYKLPNSGWQNTTVTDNFLTLSHDGNGLAYFYVRSNCGEDYFSPYSSLLSIDLPTCPSVSVEASSISFCSGDVSTLSVSSDFVSYQWYDADGAIDGAVSSAYLASTGGEYYVMVVSSDGCEVTSDVTSLTMLTVASVSTLDIDNITSSSASLDWDNASPTGVYNISYSADGGLTWVDIIGHTGSSINLTGLSPSTTYDVEITSSAYGCESEVFSSSFTTEEDCIVPENISLTATPFEVTLSWDALVGADSYKVVYKLPNSGWQNTTVTDNFLTLSHDGNGLAYFYVRSNCGEDYFSPYSSLLSIDLPTCPSVSVEASSISFCSGDVSTLSVSSDFVSYQWYDADGAIDGAVSSAYLASTGGEYYVMVVSSDGCEVTSDVTSLTMLTVASVSTLDIDNITSSSASLDWDNASPTGVYNISYSADGGLTWVDIIGHTGSSINLTGLSPSTTYDVEITSSAYGCESEVFSSSFTTEEDCIVPENISLTATPFEVTLSWDALVGADSYKVVYKLPNSGWQNTTVTDNFLTLSHDGNGLAYFYVRSNCGEDYFSPYSSLLSIDLPTCPSVSVEASSISFCSGDVSTLSVSSDFVSYQWYDADGAIDGAVSSAYLASTGGEYYVMVVSSDGCEVTSDVTSLTMLTVASVSTLDIDNITSSSASLDWDNASPTGVYNISYSADGGLTWVDIIGHTGSSINLTGLSPSTTYDVEITSSAYGCESEVFSSSFTTEEDCIVPENISLTATPFEVTLSWDALVGADSYKVVYKLPNSGWQNTTVTDNFLTLSHDGNGLAYFYVRSNCGEDYFSPYSSLLSIDLPTCPSVSVEASSISFCSGDVSTLSVSSDFVSYQWYDADGAIDGAVSSAYLASTGGEYYVMVVSSDGCEVTSDVTSLTMLTVASVSTLDIDNITSSSASLDWDNASPTGVYNISYSADGGLTWVDIIGHTGSSINLTGLSPSTTYDVEITSSAYGCESEVFSSSFTTEEDCIVPENISLTATPFEVTLSWDALVGADSYKVVYKLPNSGWQNTTVTDNFLTLSHDGNGLAYFYVRSNCGEDYFSPYSSLLSIDLPTCPSVSVEASSISFCSGDVSTLSVSSDFVSYQWYDADGAIDGAVSSAYLASTGGEYYVMVVSSDGCEVTSDVTSLTMLTVASVSTLDIDNITSSSASLDWDNASPTGVYNISYSADGGLTWVDIIGHTGSSINLTGLSPSTTYDVEITSSAYGCESEVFSSSFTTEEDCIVPENISLTATPFEVTLSWDALVGADSYKVVYKLPNSGWQNTTVTDNFLTLSHDGNGLAYFYVRSNCGEDYFSPYSSLLSIDLPTCPSVSVEASSISFCSGDVSTLSVSSDFVSYQWYDADGAIDGAVSSAYLASTGGEYYVMVVSSDGCEVTSDVTSLTMLTVASVSTLDIDNITSSSASLDWDNASPTGVYNISYSADGGLTWVDIIGHTGSSINLTGLSPSTTYDVEITSSAYGCESEVFSSSFTTEEDCIVPENISLTATPFEVTLSWDALVGADSYKVVYKLPNSGWQNTTVTDNFLTLSHDGNGLAYFYVRSNCGEDYFSPYSSLLSIDLPTCPSVSVEASSISFCSGDVSTLSVSSDFVSYQWYDADGAIDGAVSSAYLASTGGEYYVMVVSSDGCEVTSDVTSLTMLTVASVSTLDIDNITSSSASLDWDNASPTGVYNISYSADGGLTWVDIIGHTGSSINLTGLSPSTTYDVEITSSAYGCESEVFSSSFTTEEDCIVPENISLTATPFEVTLSWDALVGADSYKVVYKLPNSGWQNTTVTDNFLTLSHDGNGLAYFYVRSNCGEDYFSPYSSLLSIDLPTCPSVSVEASSISFCSGDVSTLSVSSDFVSYQWYDADGAIDGAVSSAYLASTGGEYYVMVVSSDGCEVTSDVTSLTMLTVASVSTLDIDNITSSSASLDWDNASPTGVYNISYSADGGLTWVDIIGHTGSSINLTGLSPSTTYDVEITSSAYGCESEVFSSSFVTLFECISPNNIVVNYNTSQATISWDELVGSLSYEVLYNFGLGFNSVITDSNSITLNLSGASFNVFYIRANCPDDQQSAWSEVQVFSLTCDMPSNIIVNNTGTDLTIDWEGSAPLYRLIYNIGNGWVNVYPTVSDYTISDVPLGSNVIYYIRSICDDETNFFSSWASGSYTTLSGGKLAQDISFEFEVYPNPTDGLVNISFENIVEQIVNVRLVDAFGKEVYRNQFNVGFETNFINFDISNYAKGIYFLQLVSNDTIRTERIVLH